MASSETATLRLPGETKEYIAETGDNFNARASDILETFVEAEKELGLTTDMQDMELVVLRTYLNSIQKNIQAMEAEKDKINNMIEERVDEDDEDVTIVEVSLDFDSKNV